MNPTRLSPTRKLLAALSVTMLAAVMFFALPASGHEGHSHIVAQGVGEPPTTEVPTTETPTTETPTTETPTTEAPTTEAPTTETPTTETPTTETPTTETPTTETSTTEAPTTETSAPPASELTESSENTDDSNKKMWLLIASGVAGVGAILFGVLWVVNRNKEQKRLWDANALSLAVDMRAVSSGLKTDGCEASRPGNDRAILDQANRLQARLTQLGDKASEANKMVVVTAQARVSDMVLLYNQIVQEHNMPDADGVNEDRVKELCRSLGSAKDACSTAAWELEVAGGKDTSQV